MLMITLFETSRFTIRQLVDDDIKGFFDLQSNKKAMDMVPDKVMTLLESKTNLATRINNYTTTTKKYDVWAVIEKTTSKFVGTCALVYLNDSKVEIGYRFIEQFWGKGVGTEVTKGLIDFVFNSRSETSIVADVSKFNIPSTKILEKFLVKVGESYNETDQCQDLHFELKKADYLLRTE